MAALAPTPRRRAGRGARRTLRARVAPRGSELAARVSAAACSRVRPWIRPGVVLGSAHPTLRPVACRAERRHRSPPTGVRRRVQDRRPKPSTTDHDVVPSAHPALSARRMHPAGDPDSIPLPTSHVRLATRILDAPTPPRPSRLDRLARPPRHRRGTARCWRRPRSRQQRQPIGRSRRHRRRPARCLELRHGGRHLGVCDRNDLLQHRRRPALLDRLRRERLPASSHRPEPLPPQERAFRAGRAVVAQARLVRGRREPVRPVPVGRGLRLPRHRLLRSLRLGPQRGPERPWPSLAGQRCHGRLPLPLQRPECTSHHRPSPAGEDRRCEPRPQSGSALLRRGALRPPRRCHGQQRQQQRLLPPRHLRQPRRGLPPDVAHRGDVPAEGGDLCVEGQRPRRGPT